MSLRGVITPAIVGVMTPDEPRDPPGTVYVVDFEPGLYGPFGSRDAASDWARAFTKGNGSWCVCPLGSPEATELPCKCCALEPAEPGDPDGYCTDCSHECTDD